MSDGQILQKLSQVCVWEAHLSPTTLEAEAGGAEFKTSLL